MISTITLKLDGTSTEAKNAAAMTLTSPSVVTLGFGPEKVARFDRVGNDLVLVLQDGSKVTIVDFFVTYDDGRNEVVFVDENGVTWWGQYSEPWSSFQIAELEAGPIPAAYGFAGPGLLMGLLGGGAALGALGGSTNALPVAVDDVVGVIEAGVVDGGVLAEPGQALAQGNVLANDSDADGNILRVESIAINGTAGALGASLAGTYGSLVLNADGSYSYLLDNTLGATQALASGMTGTEVFTYTISDGKGGTATATLTITVAGTNDLPVISGADTGAVQEDAVQVATGQLVVQDVDQGDTHLWTLPGGTGAYGTLGLTATGGWSYLLANTLPAVQALAVGETLIDVIRVRVTDSHGGWTEQDVTITIRGTNDAPVIDAVGSGLSATLTEIADGAAGENTQDHIATGTIRFSDMDTTDSGHTAVVAPVGDASSYLGSITLLPPVDGKVDWQFTVNDAALDNLPEGQVLTQHYTVTVADKHGGTAVETITITLVGRNDSPVAQDDASLIAVGQTAVMDVLANDSDVDRGETAKLLVTKVDGQPITAGATITLTGGQGTVTMTGAGVLQFTPASGFTGQLVVPYTVDDSSGTTNATGTGGWVINVVNAVISDNASPAGQGIKDDVLARIDDLEHVAISGRGPIGGTVTALTITDGTTTITVPATIAADGTIATTVDVRGLQDGTLTLALSVTDAAGNTVTTYDTILKDTVTAVSIDPVAVIEGAIPTITGTGQYGDTVLLTIDGGTAIPITVLQNGTWSYTPTAALNAAEVSLSITAVDAFGNIATHQRKVAALSVEDQVIGQPEDIRVSEAGLLAGSAPSSGAEVTLASLKIGTSELEISRVNIAGTAITLAQLQAVGTTPIPAITTVYGSLSVTGYEASTGVISYPTV